ncbi:hypothetical protein [Erythrobacter rubeus]|uniref:Uncharacterized protein n=1 Tax=Erythrobacter rubeus TaxID=2760803 RepID=A0ABR8KNP2_9SPHN|nr:hypothetical protein [Erythrobacter rubeus]MBD2840763.1 hypothetical protein [Erythrobacter rubeus]
MADQTYTSAQLAHAINMKHDNFRKRFAAYHWLVLGDDAMGSGVAHRFTKDNALVYALVRALNLRGFDLGDAFQIAQNGLKNEGDTRRDAFKLYPEELGKTYFFAYPAGTFGECYPSSEIKDLGDLTPFFDHKGVERGAGEEFVAINLTALRKRVMSTLEGERG